MENKLALDNRPMSAKLKKSENIKSSHENLNKPKVDKLEIVVENEEKRSIVVKSLNQIENQNAKEKKTNKQNYLQSANLNSNIKSAGVVDEIELNRKHAIGIDKKEIKEDIQFKDSNRESSPITEHKLFSAPASTIDNIDLKANKSESVVKYLVVYFQLILFISLFKSFE